LPHDMGFILPSGGDIPGGAKGARHARKAAQEPPAGAFPEASFLQIMSLPGAMMSGEKGVCVMDEIVLDCLASLELGELRVFENMGVIPLYSPMRGGPLYLALKEALEEGILVVGEVEEGGSVPELKVENRGERPVLLLDGEELHGAKQNRVLNTTILIPAKSELVIPVSCTEAGRWHYTSHHFEESGALLAASVRSGKVRAVSRNLMACQEYLSDQGEVWEGIDRLAQKAMVSSPTQAMRDIYVARIRELEEYLEAFPCQDRQRGLLVLINGMAVGMDMLSRAAAYRTLHPKLLKSYALEAYLSQMEKASKASKAKARDFLARAKDCQEKKYRSVGLGWDYRFSGKRMVGSALIYRKKAVHLAFFEAAEAEKVGRIADLGSRRGFRTDN